MKRTNTKKEGKQQFRFYRSHLPTIVWGGNGKIADFSEGHFTTDDKPIALILLDKGYPQIPLDSTEPPAILVTIPGDSLRTNESLGKGLDDVKIGPAGINKTKAKKPVVIQE